MSSEEMIERVLFIAPLVHVYMIPPLSSSRGYVASTWTKPPAQEIYVDQAQKISPRIRVVERSPVTSGEDDDGDEGLGENGSVVGNNTQIQPSSITVSVQLESPQSGELFAAAPYTNANAVMQAVDSARFFAITVVAGDERGGGSRKAVLGIGFEERSEAFDFGVALQEARKSLPWAVAAASWPGNLKSPTTPTTPMTPRTPMTPMMPNTPTTPRMIAPIKRDWSLKAGETLHVDMPKNSAARRATTDEQQAGATTNSTNVTVTAAGPNHQQQQDGKPGHFAGMLLPPPPSAASIRAEKRRSQEIVDQVRKKELADLGFDDGEFGEFQ